MEGPDLIACLFPFGRGLFYARGVVSSHENISRFVDAQLKRKEKVYDRDSRESTASLDEVEVDGLRLSFSHGPKGGNGFVLGKDPNTCDIVLPKWKGISACQCYLTFDDQNRLILQDRSSNDTIVSYDREGAEKRRNFTWIPSGHKFSMGKNILSSKFVKTSNFK
ncbi:hypothetical protein AJ80_04586 [Polytolypa hystricis UAMH7299]|uniref:FHA domain-containing protein n=1 Tax=Polytolypa hystricis (strain UAMH7299) TaxID=1447883 RepID=A0A2B7YAS5_POLH7|nr:hypothetical protein AJ80_04586 [Polytolypa hystricis UAMH7299]